MKDIDWNDFEDKTDIVIEDENGDVKNFEATDLEFNFEENEIEKRELVKEVEFSMSLKPEDPKAMQKLMMDLSPIYEQYILKGYNVKGESL